MPLTDVKCRQAKPSDKLIKLSDAGGLQLHIFPNGSKLWRGAYRYDGKQKTFAMGGYPGLSLQDARAAWLVAKAQLVDGLDPTTARRIDKLRAVSASGRVRVGPAICDGSAGAAEAPGPAGGDRPDPPGRLVRADIERDLRALKHAVEQDLATGRACQAFARANGLMP